MFFVVSSLQFSGVLVNNDAILGAPNCAFSIAMESAAAKKYLYGAAVSGYLKRLIGNWYKLVDNYHILIVDQLSQHCNATIQFGLPLANNRGFIVSQ